MKGFVAILLFFVTAIATAQTDSIAIGDRMNRLDKALIEKDTPAIKQLMHKSASFGHSNGWVQNRADVVKDMARDYLVYKKLENEQVQISAQDGWASVRMITKAAGIRDQKEFELTLHVLQVWIKTKNGWQLIARQSAKSGS
jgi:hypothetical protein